MSNEVQGRLDLIRQVHSLAVTVNVQEEDLWLSPEEVVVQGSDFQPMLKQRRHDGIDFLLQQHQIAHHDVVPAVTLGQSKPSTETERRRHRVVRNAHVQIVARYVDLEHVGLVVARLTNKFENLLVVARHVLRMCHRSVSRETNGQQKCTKSPDCFSHVILQFGDVVVQVRSPLIAVDGRATLNVLPWPSTL